MNISNKTTHKRTTFCHLNADEMKRLLLEKVATQAGIYLEAENVTYEVSLRSSMGSYGTEYSAEIRIYEDLYQNGET